MQTFVRQSEFFKVILPPLLAVLFFIVTIFGVALPATEQNMLNQKRLLLIELVDTVISILTNCDTQVKEKKLSLAEAQMLAKEQIRELHYGPNDRKNYYWINDTSPKMVMHPYRTDLEQQDLSSLADKSGKHLFVEMIEVVRKNGAGFVPYMWQFNDDSSRVGKKLSYVKLFQPWDWVIGTGIYLDDVSAEVAKISKKLTSISLAILLAISGLSAFIIHQQLITIKKRQVAEAEVERYRHNLERLVEERTMELQQAQSKIKILRGFLPICANCKKIRDDKGYWNKIESYIRNHSEAQFTHGICPDCARELYPELQLSQLQSPEEPAGHEQNEHTHRS